MCGIFGYVGKNTDAAEFVFRGLKLLEYRGYDSWGVAVKKGKKLVVDKRVGMIGSAQIDLPHSNFGIGHTRWATHGGVTKENAHPHLDCSNTIAVVHNGIIENHAELRDMLIAKGHRFLSGTDTEVVCHLVEEYVEKEGFASAVRDAFNKLRGLNAIVIAYAPSQEIIAAKTGSPLVVGIGDDGYYIASDATGIARHTKNLLFLKDKEMVIIGKDLQLLSLPQGKKLIPHIETVDWKVEDVEKGKFNHFMIKEIYDQPKVLRNLAEDHKEQVRLLVRLINKAVGTFFIGAGTAYHASLAGTYLFSDIAGMHVNTAVASEFNYLEDFLTKDSLIIALSQSGETIDVIEPLNRAKQRGSKVVAITNVLGSSIYRLSDVKFLLGAGPEKAVASTKAYVAKLAVLLMLVFSVAGKQKEVRSMLLTAASEVDRLLESKNVNKIRKLAKVLAGREHMYTIGRGVSFATALEAALKIKEVSYIHTEGLAGGELKHGTIALIDKGTPCIVFAPADDSFQAIISNATEIKARGGFIIGIGPQKSNIFDEWIEVIDTSQTVIITHVVVAQLLAYFLAVEKGLDPDKPRNLAKSVTVK